MRKIAFTASLLALAAAPGFAQSGADGMDPTRPVAPETGTGSIKDISQQTWSDDVRDVFFEDAAMTSLRATDEMEKRWAALDPEARERAVRDCQAYLMDAGSMGGASSGGIGGALTPDADEAGTTGEDLGGTDTPAPVPEDTTNASDAPASPGDASVWTQACSFVTSFKPQ
ncbi:hypothetical protein RSWS8N_02130 [Cereibacter sphaeroides WS8N]|uniref:hypothetical protein n=1 Tax=Cereibacter sphaeroides TaxID=1063 RepID=UPI00020DF8FA|nr:hypothetical protein [Cereibacter sphaeroides]EGJ20838.1 hypothetical protein RSWS8N_02130 [Cereibacter sphaeroides WS8N]